MCVYIYHTPNCSESLLLSCCMDLLILISLFNRQEQIADRKSANETLVLTQEMAEEYYSSFFEAMSPANLQ